MARNLTAPAIWFACQTCNKKLKAFPSEIGEEMECPCCDGLVIVPPQSNCSARNPNVAPPAASAPAEEGLVPMALSVPNVGEITTKVTQKTADTMATTFLGGMLVALGVTIALIFGVKLQSRA